MFSPREHALERGWPGRIDGDVVVQLAAQTLESFLTGGGTAREHACFRLQDVVLRAPVLRPPSIRFFSTPHEFSFGNPASVHGPEEAVHAPAPAHARFSVGAVIGDAQRIGGYTLVNDWCAPSLPPPKDRDFATTIGPWVETELDDASFAWEEARAFAALHTALRPGDVLVAPPFALGGAEASSEGLGTLRALLSSEGG